MHTTLDIDGDVVAAAVNLRPVREWFAANASRAGLPARSPSGWAAPAARGDQLPTVRPTFWNSLRSQ
ncbi:hypothetical protein I546_0343 [Mycobacterium kansasii 732]|nr:hypothetical protein I546_0343 [Mycobacterium kansasii 732]